MESLFEGSIAPDAETSVQDNSSETMERQAATPFEPFLQDWYPAPAPKTDVLTVTNRQLAIIGFIGILAMGLMAGLAYVAGRVASSQEPGRVLMVESAQAVPVPVQSPIVTQPGPALAAISAPSHTNAAIPAPSPVPSSAPTSSTVAASAKASPVPATAAPVQSTLAFWQVGALDKGMANVSLKYLEENGIPGRLEPISGSTQLRVLVGPASGQELTALKDKLSTLGFQTLLKPY